MSEKVTPDARSMQRSFYEAAWSVSSDLLLQRRVLSELQRPVQSVLQPGRLPGDRHSNRTQRGPPRGLQGRLSKYLGLPGTPSDPIPSLSGAAAIGNTERRVLGEMCTWQAERSEANPYLNLNDDPRLKRTGFGFGLGSSKSLKKA